MEKTYYIETIEDALRFIGCREGLMDIGQVNPKVRNKLNYMAKTGKLIKYKKDFSVFGWPKTVWDLP